jgi:predicted lactoylglutathione lyase
MNTDNCITSFQHCAPVLSVSNLLRSRDFYVKKLGFKVSFEWGKPVSFIGLERDDVALHLSDEKHSRHEAGKSNINITTNEVDSYFSHCNEFGVDIITEPADRGRGMRDFGIEDIDGNILNFACKSITG